ncbi:hypothetical protein HID58_082623 [Brassica napus]|uniref:Uncharacterized protein n=1 Tax=Brassica napus TaxID=3708 RepID=A0ABQ7YB66_BRANA|nr:hypothetical protein HID58_082623 [Brassica napus]
MFDSGKRSFVSSSLSAYVFWEAVAPSAPPSPAWSLGVTDLWICVLIVTLPLDLSLVSHAIGVCATVRFVLSLRVKSIGVGVGLKLSRVFPVVLDEISRLFSMKLSVEKLGDEDGYGVFATPSSGETSGVLHLLRLTLICGVPMA